LFPQQQQVAGPAKVFPSVHIQYRFAQIFIIVWFPFFRPVWGFRKGEGHQILMSKMPVVDSKSSKMFSFCLAWLFVNFCWSVPSSREFLTSSLEVPGVCVGQFANFSIRNCFCQRSS